MTERFSEWLTLFSNRDWALTNFAALAFVAALGWHGIGLWPEPARRWSRGLLGLATTLGIGLAFTFTYGGSMDILIWIGVGLLVGGAALLIFQPETRRAIFDKLAGKK